MWVSLQVTSQPAAAGQNDDDDDLVRGPRAHSSPPHVGGERHPAATPRNAHYDLRAMLRFALKPTSAHASALAALRNSRPTRTTRLPSPLRAGVLASAYSPCASRGFDVPVTSGSARDSLSWSAPALCAQEYQSVALHGLQPLIACGIASDWTPSKMTMIWRWREQRRVRLCVFWYSTPRASFLRVFTVMHFL